MSNPYSWREPSYRLSPGAEWLAKFEREWRKVPRKTDTPQPTPADPAACPAEQPPAPAAERSEETTMSAA